MGVAFKKICQHMTEVWIRSMTCLIIGGTYLAQIMVIVNTVVKAIIECVPADMAATLSAIAARDLGINKVFVTCITCEVTAMKGAV